MGTITKALDLLGLFARERAEIGLGEFVRLTGRDKATVHRHLVELAENGFLEQDPDSRAYRLGPAVLRLAALRETLFPTRKLMQPIVQGLADAVGELAHASLLQGKVMSPLVHADPGVHGVQVYFDIAEMLPLHATSSGISALTFCSEEFRAQILEDPLSKHTDQTVSDPARLREIIASTRRFGVCQLTGAFDDAVSSVGTPIFGENGHALGALAVAMPTARATPEKLRTIAVRLLHEAERATIALGGSVPLRFAPLPETWPNGA